MRLDRNSAESTKVTTDIIKKKAFTCGYSIGWMD